MTRCAENIYLNMTQTPAIIDTDYLRSVLRLSDDEIITQAEGYGLQESNTARVMKLRVRIENKKTDREKKLFLKTAKSNDSANVYHGLSVKEAKFFALVRSIEGIEIPVPKCHDAVIFQGEKGFAILMDDVSDDYRAPEPADFTNTDTWLSCAESLGRLHAAFWNLKNTGGDAPDVKSEEELSADFINDKKDLERFLEYAGARFEERTRTIFRKALEINYAGILKNRRRVLARNNVTVANGDSHIYNFMLPGKKGLNPLVLDFQFWGKWIGTGDLAHLTRVAFPGEHRKTLHTAIAKRYYQTLLSHGVAGYSWDECWADYRMSVATMVTIPLWQYAGFGLGYDEWDGDVGELIDNFNCLSCDKL